MSGGTTRNATSGADDLARAAQFRSNPNLVLEREHDREKDRARAKEPTGEAESLAGRITLKQMGDRAQRTAPPLAPPAPTAARQRRRDAHRRLAEARALAHRRRSVLDAHGSGANDGSNNDNYDDDYGDGSSGSGGTHYVPQTRETRAAFEGLLALALAWTGDQPRDVVRSVAEDVLAAMKDPAVAPADRPRAVAAVVAEAGGGVPGVPGAAPAPLPPETFAEVAQLCARITDWVDRRADDAQQAAAASRAEDEGISVTLDEDDEEDDGGGGGGGDGDDGDGVFGSSSSSESSESESGSDSEAEMGDDNSGGDKKRKKQRRRSGEEDSEAASGKVRARDVDAFWLQRELHAYESDAAVAQDLAERALAAMEAAGDDDRAAETALVALLGYERMGFVARLLRNRHTVVWCTRYAQAESEPARQAVLARIAASGPAGTALLRELAPQQQQQQQQEQGQEEQQKPMEEEEKRKEDGVGERVKAMAEQARRSRRTIDLEALAFAQGGHLMSNERCELPAGSYRTVKKGYEEIHIPRARAPAVDAGALVPLSALPAWARPLFPAHVRHLNYVQSRIFATAYGSGANMLLCAPTGSGKTIAAMLAMLQVVGQYVDAATGTLDLTGFKIVYIAPMKSLVQEMAGNFAKRFEPLHMRVRELSGDATLTKQEIAETQVLVTTPEKWDIVTRKTGGGLVGQAVRLVIIDEIHLLHDTRGPVLEALVARTLRHVEQTHEAVRLVGLSATLPNYEDVATFLRVRPEHVFAFDNACRPVPLEQTYIGVAEKRPARRVQLMNEICYDLVAARAGRSQVLVFVHSRKETARAARFMRDAAIAHDTIAQFLRDDGSGSGGGASASKAILQSEAAACASADLRDLLPYGFGVHHAGLTKDDRRLVEDLFAAGHLQVLVSTSTLAWGVNLPAHTVIIRGTQVYSPERGRWTELSPLDVMQMVGRAGRPQYDTEGEGILITTQGELQYYLSLLNHQLPIESQLIAQLPDTLNAEIVLGNVRSVRDGVNWLAYTYLYICMLREPALYGVPVPSASSGKNGENGGNDDGDSDDPYLERYRADLVHSAAVVLDRHNLIKYDRKTGGFQVTDLGRVASHYYVSHDSMATYNDLLKPTLGDVELFRVFSASHEFRLIPVRAEEKLELETLVERVPIPVKESIDEPAAKVNVLLQAYISRLRLDGFALMADMVYVTQSAGRIVRALFDIVRRRGWAALAERCLALCQMVERRLWQSQTPLRQFGALGDALARRLERQDHCTFLHLYELSSQDLGTLVRQPDRGRQLWRLVHAFPKLDVAVSVLPLTRALLRVELVLTPDFAFDEALLRARSLGFWVLVEDVDAARLLHAQYVVLKRRRAADELVVTFTVPVLDPLPPLYYVRVVADRWLGAATTVPVSLRRLVLPDKFAPPTELHDMPPVRLDAATLGRADYAELYATVGPDGTTHPLELNALQSQAFHVLYETDASTLFCAPPASGKTLCAELAILRAWNGIQQDAAADAAAAAAAASGEGATTATITSKKTGKTGNKKTRATPMVYVAANETCAARRFREWRARFARLGMRVTVLTGEGAADLRLVERSDLVVATAAQWEHVSRRWRQRRVLQGVRLFVADDLQTLADGAAGAALEVAVSRMRCVAAQPGARLVGLAASLAAARDVAEWLGATPATLFNVHPSVRPLPLEVHIQGFDHAEHSARLAAMHKPLVQAVRRHAARRAPVLVFVPSRHDAAAVARELAALSSPASSSNSSNSSDDKEDSEGSISFLGIPAEELAAHTKDVQSPLLQSLLAAGIGMVWEGMAPAERLCVERLFAAGAVQVVLATHEQVWAMDGMDAHVVVVMGTEAYSGAEHRYVEYPVSELLQMTARACRSGTAPSCPSSLSSSSSSSSSFQQQGRGGGGGGGGGGKGEMATCVLLCDAARKDFYRRFLLEPVPVESGLPQHLHDFLNAEVVVETVASKQDAVDYLTWTLLYRRLPRNPNYYELAGATPAHISDYLSELVESTLADLERARCVAVDDMDVSALNLGIIAAYYRVAYTTVELFSTALTERTRVRGLLEILAAATEYDTVPVRHHEAAALRRAAQHLPCPVPALARNSSSDNSSDDGSTSTATASLKDPHVKTHILLQAHLTRTPLPPELQCDQRAVLLQTPRLLRALVDVVGNSGWLAPALAAMELSQLVAQALWQTDSVLLQLPHLGAAAVARAAAHHAASVYELVDLDPAARADVFAGLSAREIRDIAAVCNDYPNIDMQYALSLDAAAVHAEGTPVSVRVTLTHPSDDGDGDGDGDSSTPFTVVPVHAPFFPQERFEEWWLVVGEQQSNTLVSIKRLALTKRTQTAQLDFVLPAQPGVHEYTIMLMSDSYLGCDQEYHFTLTVGPSKSETPSSSSSSSGADADAMS